MGARTIAPLCVLLVSFTLRPCDAQGPPQGLPAFTVESAEYAATLREKKLDVSGDFVVELLRDGRVFVRLLPAGAAVADLKIQQGDAHPCRSAEGVGFLAEKKGKYRVGLRFVLDVDQRGRTGRAVFPLAIAGRCRIDLALPPGQKVETKPEAPVEGAGAGKMRIFPQAGEKVELEWYPQEYAKEVEPLVRGSPAGFGWMRDWSRDRPRSSSTWPAVGWMRSAYSCPRPRTCGTCALMM
jgi:hypothetical protein